MKTEKWLAEKLKKEFKTVKLRDFQFCRNFSVPDLWAIIGVGKSCWIELKSIQSINSSIPLRKGQVQWIENCVKDGGVCFVLVLVDYPFVITLFECTDVRSLVTRKYSTLGAQRVFTGVAQEPRAWRILEQFLLSSSAEGD